jgi:arginyl-tRNA synthetase
MKHYVLQLLQGILSEMQVAGKLQDIPGIEVGLPELAHGDYFTNVAMRLAGQLNANPNAIATDLAEKLTAADKASENKFESVQAAGGFINFKLSHKALAERTNQLQAGEFITGDKIGKGKKVVFEYSSPNTNKPLHIGHVRNDVYGKACINLLQTLGYDVTTCEIINDRGIHIMKSVLMYMKFGEGKSPEQEGMKPDHFVGHFYKMFGEKSSVSEQAEQELNDEAQDLLRRWEAGDHEVRGLWEKMNAWFFEGVKQTYEKEGTTFDEVDFESEIYDKGRDLVRSGAAKDWEKNTKDEKVFSKNVLSDLHDGEIILLHGHPWTTKYLDNLMTNIEKKGYSFVNPSDITE